MFSEESLYINKQKSIWDNAKRSCRDNKLVGEEELKSCQPHNCNFTQLQTINGLRDDRDILWLNGYLLRSPFLQYEGKSNRLTNLQDIENECQYPV